MAWSQFYGWVKGRAVSEATRVGNKDTGLGVGAASKTGAIIVRMLHWQGQDCFEIRLTEWGESKFDDILLAKGSFVKGEGPPVIVLDDATVRAHVEREALRAMRED
jgi:hypothetical protein